MLYTGIRSGPLWDAREQEFVGEHCLCVCVCVCVCVCACARLPFPLAVLLSGMLTITDFIHILRHHYKSPIVSALRLLVRQSHLHL